MTIPTATTDQTREEQALREAHHLAFQAHAEWVAATFPAALAREPDIRCSEWVRRNPFGSEEKPLDNEGC